MKASHRFDNAKRRRGDNHDRQRMLTPSYVLEPVRKLLGGFDLDPCTELDNPCKAKRFFCLPSDGCVQPWEGKTIWCNPPYGEARDRWVAKCIEESKGGKRIVLLIPSHTDTRTFQKAVSSATSILFTKGRLKFGVVRANGRQEAASHGSALIGYNVDLTSLSALGAVFKAIPYDYSRAIKDDAGVSQDRLQIKRILRKLVREAVIESWRTTIAAEPSYKDAGVLEDNVRFEAKRIARRLVP